VAASLAEVTDDGGETRGVHLAEAGDLAAAEPLLRSAAERAYERGDYGRGRDLLDRHTRALDGLGAPADHAMRHAGAFVLACIAHREGRVDEAQAAIRRAWDTTDPRTWVKVRLQHGDIVRKQGRLQEAREVLRGALEVARSSADAALEASVQLTLGHTEFDLGAFEAAEAHLHRALHLAAGTIPRTEALAWKTLGELEKGRGRMAEALAHFERARRLAQRVGDRWTQGSVLNSMGDSARYQGRHDEALALYEAAGDVYRAIGSTSVVYTDYNAALVHLERRDFPAVRAVLEHTLPRFEALGHRATVADARIARAACECAEGRTDAAFADLDAALEGYRATGVADVDSAELAELAASILIEHGADATRAWRIAAHVWTALGRTDRAERASAGLQGSSERPGRSPG
jgi:tetratricopeptide (TPR) repeat protein